MAKNKRGPPNSKSIWVLQAEVLTHLKLTKRQAKGSKDRKNNGEFKREGKMIKMKGRCVLEQGDIMGINQL